MDRNLILSIVLSVLIIVGFQYFFQSFSPPTPVNAPSKIEVAKKNQAHTKPSVDEIKSSKEKPVSETEIASTKTLSGPSLQQSATTQVKEARIKIDTPKYEAILTNIGGKIISFRLKNYTTKIDSSDLVNLFPPEGPDTSAPSIRLTRSDEVFSDSNLAYSGDTEGPAVLLDKPDAEKTIIYRGVSPSGLIIYKKFVFHADTYSIDLSYSLENPSSQSRDYLVTFPLRKFFSEDPNQRFSWNSVEVLLDGSLKDYYFKDIKGRRRVVRARRVGRVGGCILL